MLKIKYNKIRLFKNSFNFIFHKNKLVLKRNLIYSMLLVKNNRKVLSLVKKNSIYYKLKKKKLKLSLFLLKLKNSFNKLVISKKLNKFLYLQFNSKIVYYKKKSYINYIYSYRNSNKFKKKNWKLWKKFKNCVYIRNGKKFKNKFYKVRNSRLNIGSIKKINFIFNTKKKNYKNNKLFSKYKFINFINFNKSNNIIKTNYINYANKFIYIIKIRNSSIDYWINNLLYNYFISNTINNKINYELSNYNNNRLLNNNFFNTNIFKKFKLKRKKIFILNKLNTIDSCVNNNIIFNIKQTNKIKFLHRVMYKLFNSIITNDYDLFLNRNNRNYNRIINKKLFSRNKKFYFRKFNLVSNRYNQFSKVYISGKRFNKVDRFLVNTGIKIKFKHRFYKTRNIKSVFWSRRINKRKKYFLWNKKYLFLWKRIKINKYKNIGILNQNILYSKYTNISKKRIKILKFINKILYLNRKLHLFYSKNMYKSFKWKFILRKWFYSYSKWKRLSVFNVLIRQAWDDYRKLKKNFFFIKLFKANFNYLIGINEHDLLNKWVSIRRNNNNNADVVGRFNQMLQLKLDSLVLFLGFSTTRFMSQELVRCGCVRINGSVSTNINNSIDLNNIIQFDLNIKNNLKKLYKLNHWLVIKSRLKYSSFIHILWPLLMFTLVRRPNTYELLEESIFNERWVRFFIRYFPIKVSHYSKPKIKWYKY
jgi:hypothetical protein